MIPKQALFNALYRSTGKYLFQSLKTLAQVFSYEFCKISKNTIFTEHLWAAASDLKEFIFF